MKVFISWSGETSLKVAQVLREWLPSVIQSVEPYVSSEDIDKGARWSTDIAKELENSTFGILCVTKENLEAPWLSFEAGALSKTMEKSFVSPFLFDIKRSEVQGPILQFQSTIFEKDDIKKMVSTLNKASGNAGISATQLDKTFEVWYSSLEKSLNAIKNKKTTSTEGKKDENSVSTTAILEEILELTRDNQKLIRNPDFDLSEEIEEIKEAIKDLSDNNSEPVDNRRRYGNALTLMEIINDNFRDNDPVKFLMLLSFFREDIPWIYHAGKEVLEIVKSECDKLEKHDVITKFKRVIEFTFRNPIGRRMMGRSGDEIIPIREMIYSLENCLENIALQ